MCKFYEFQCDNGDCVPDDSVCDRVNDCEDNSDEEQGCGMCFAAVCSKAVWHNMCLISSANIIYM